MKELTIAKAQAKSSAKFSMIKYHGEVAKTMIGLLVMLQDGEALDAIIKHLQLLLELDTKSEMVSENKEEVANND